MPGRTAEAIAEYQAALRLKPGYGEALVDLGAALAADPGRAAEALGQFQQAVELHPDLAGRVSTWPTRCCAPPRARRHRRFEATLHLDPDNAAAHINLGAALSADPRRAPEALAHLQAAVRLRPDDTGAHYNLGNVLSEMPGRAADAMAEYRAALRA